MEHIRESETFTYTYSAKDREEINKIRQKYEAPKEDQMEQLRRLDAGVTQKATARALILGILGALVMGTGMSLVMSDIGEILHMGHALSMVLGIIIGIMGLAPVCCAYPIYTRTLKKERERIAPEILKLTDELLK